MFFFLLSTQPSYPLCPHTCDDKPFHLLSSALPASLCLEAYSSGTVEVWCHLSLCPVWLCAWATELAGKVAQNHANKLCMGKYFCLTIHSFGNSFIFLISRNQTQALCMQSMYVHLQHIGTFLTSSCILNLSWIISWVLQSVCIFLQTIRLPLSWVMILHTVLALEISKHYRQNTMLLISLRKQKQRRIFTAHSIVLLILCLSLFLGEWTIYLPVLNFSSY